MNTDNSQGEGPDLRGPAVIVDGSVINGFTFTGPFDTVEAAAEWHATKRLAGYLGLPTTIVILETPRQEVLDECAKRLGGCAPQLDCGADRKSVASQRCRDTGGQPFDSAPSTLTAAERGALDWACCGLECPDIEHDDNYDSDAAAILRNLLARLGG